MKILRMIAVLFVGTILVIPARAEDLSGLSLFQQDAGRRVADVLLALGLPDLKKPHGHTATRPILPADTICKQPETCCCRVADGVSCQDPNWCASLGGQCVEQSPPYPVVVNCE